MEPILIYFLQTSIGIVLFYLFYLFLLKNETFYNVNRYFLLAGIGFSLILPLFPISYASPIAFVNNSDSFSLSENPAIMELGNPLEIQEVAWSWLNFSHLLLSIYILGMIFFLTRLVWQTVRVFWQISQSKYQTINGIKIINKPTTVPFSFFNVVFIDIQEYSKRELSNIIAHEKVHILERHWVDLLIIELLTIVFWINPIVWLYERSIKQNHEYLADQGVLLAGYSHGQYQALLINQLMGVKVLGFAHNLNFSLNKKRMEMMKKEKSTGARKMKLLLSLPLIVLLLFGFAKREYVLISQNSDQFNDQEIFGSQKTLQEPLLIYGRVLTMDGTPIEGAEFSASGKALDKYTKANGIFEFEFPKGYEYFETIMNVGYDENWKGIKITVNHNGFENATMIIDPEKERKSSEIQMRKNLIVKGRVWNNENRPLVAAKVVLKGSNNATVTDANGEFEIEASEGLILTLSHRGYKTIDYALVGEDIEYPTIIMKADKNRRIVVDGTVKGENDNPLQGANVVIQNSTNGTITDANGKFMLEVPDSSLLVISFIGYETSTYGISSKFTHNTDFRMTYTLPPAVYNIDLPELIGEEIIDIPPPLMENEHAEIMTMIEDMPIYKDGGMYKLAQDINKMTSSVTPKTKDRGEAIVGFTVTEIGAVVNTYIVESSNNKTLDTSALEIVQKLDNWNPGIQAGKAVKVNLTVPVKFQ